MNVTYCQLDTIVETSGNRRSPVLFIHGFPDSPRMFAAYYGRGEHIKPWRQGRNLYAFAFPNRHTNPRFPPLRALQRGVLWREFNALVNYVARRSPTGQVVIVAHDWGAAYTWRYARARKTPPIEKLVALSVGSSLRYDWAEHGSRAFTWLYGLFFGSAWWLPFMRRVVANAIVQKGGYRSDTAAKLYLDAYHYWDRWSLLLTLPYQVAGLIDRRPEYLDFPFPVLFIRSPRDRFLSTAAFEQALQDRPGCRCVELADANHWFPEQQAERVLVEIREFLA